MKGPFEPDPVTIEILGSRLAAVAERMGVVLVRSAFSPNIKERKDCSTAIFDAEGRLLAQAEHIPLHLGSMLGVVGEVLRRYPSTHIKPGDAFVANDPYSGGGTHLPDVTLVSPFYYGDHLLGFVANNAHHADIGGAVPGGIAGDTRSIYAEGLRLPPVRLAREGQVQEDLLEVILLNCRSPDDRLTDLKGQLAANAEGVKALTEICDVYGAGVFTTSSRAWLDYTERRFREAVRGIPRGAYSFTDFLDDDGAGNQDIPIKVTLRTEGDTLVLDFTGSAEQVAGAINVVPAALKATVYYSVRSVLDPGIPANEGFHRTIRILAPEGSIVNARPPAAVGARTDTCQRIAGTIFGAFAQALPGRVPAGSNDASTAVVFAGQDSFRDRYFVYVEALGGGGGGRPGKDGLHGIQVHVTNTSNLPVEALESEYPLRVEEYSLIDGSGGEGRYRGGMGIRRSIRVLVDGLEFSCHGDRQRLPPWGLFGGKEGTPGRFEVVRAGTIKVLPSKTSGVRLKPGDLVRISTPGGGGYGEPVSR